jgi:seryl-tRNA synthetase
MLDIRLIRENPTIIEKDLIKRNAKERIKILKDLIADDKKWRELLADGNKLRQRRNEISEEISKLKKSGKSAEKVMQEAKEIPVRIKSIEQETDSLQTKIKQASMQIPNIMHESVPTGKDESENVEIRRWGKPPKFNFEPKDHVTILQSLGLIDLERAAKVAGHGFFILKNELVLLDLALQRFGLEFLRKKGFTIIEPPFMVNKKSYEGVAPLQDFEDMMFKIQDYDLFLIATAEHPIGAMFINETIDKKDLPLKFAGVSSCFRKELGTHGKYTKGLFRVHQFNKIEQFVYAHPDDSWELFEEIQKNAEKLYQDLGLHHRVIEICSGDLGIMKARSYDIEFWMADGKFRELGSNSNLTDYSARRLNIKFREGPGKPPAGFVHTLNNTALATSRTMIAIIEQFQKKDGSVEIPKVLHPFMGGIKKLEKKD